MKATLEFSLPEETEQHQLALNGWKYETAIDEYFNWIRAELKYNDQLTEEKAEWLEQARDKLVDIIRERQEY